jgi:hypothetical protein
MESATRRLIYASSDPDANLIAVLRDRGWIVEAVNSGRDALRAGRTGEMAGGLLDMSQGVPTLIEGFESALRCTVNSGHSFLKPPVVVC